MFTFCIGLGQRQQAVKIHASDHRKRSINYGKDVAGGGNNGAQNRASK